MESVSDIVIDIVNSYRELPQDFADINEIMYYRKQLATYSVTLSTEIGVARKEWKIAEALYETSKNQKRLSYERFGTTKADWRARANMEDEFKDLNTKETIFWNLDYIFRAVREVLSEMNQRISYLREEQKQSRYYED